MAGAVITYCRRMQKSSAPNEDTINIDVAEKPQRFQDAGVIKNFEVIPLESDGKILVARIDKIIMHGGLIYIANYRPNANVLIFDTLGRFVREIERKGRGPLEYIQFCNMFINEEDNTLNIVDRYPAKILKFPLDGSGMPDVITISGISLEDVIPCAEGYICYTTFSSQNEDKTLMLVDRSGKRIGRDIEMREGWESNAFPGAHVFSKFREKIYFKPVYESPIFRYGETGKFEPAIALDFGSYNWPKEIKTADDFLNETKYSTLAGDYVGYLYNFQETEDYWLFMYVYSGQLTFTVYDKATCKSTQYRPDVNTDKYFIDFGNVASITENHIIAWVDAAAVISTLGNEERERHYPEQFERLRQRAGNLDVNDNQVLIIYDI